MKHCQFSEGCGILPTMSEMPPQNQPQTAVPPHNSDIEENKDLAALSYAWVMAVFVYFWKKDSPFVRFHARQGMVLFVLSIICWMIPFVGRLLELILLCLCVLGFMAAAQGEWRELPIIADVAAGRWGHIRSSWRSALQSIVSWVKKFRAGKKNETRAESTPPTSAPPPTSNV